jgi:heme-degrading monooxygenase HmoA
MLVRLTFCRFSPQHIEEAKRIYNQQIISVVREQKGNLGIRLLEPVNETDDFISITEWKTKDDAEAYVASGVFQELVSMLDRFFEKKPVVKTYTSEMSEIPAGEVH